MEKLEAQGARDSTGIDEAEGAGSLAEASNLEKACLYMLFSSEFSTTD